VVAGGYPCCASFVPDLLAFVPCSHLAAPIIWRHRIDAPLLCWDKSVGEFSLDLSSGDIRLDTAGDMRESSDTSIGFDSGATCASASLADYPPDLPRNCPVVLLASSLVEIAGSVNCPGVAGPAIIGDGMLRSYVLKDCVENFGGCCVA
jgi:hypothetical protein